MPKFKIRSRDSKLETIPEQSELNTVNLQTSSATYSTHSSRSDEVEIQDHLGGCIEIIESKNEIEGVTFDWRGDFQEGEDAKSGERYNRDVQVHDVVSRRIFISHDEGDKNGGTSIDEVEVEIGGHSDEKEECGEHEGEESQSSLDQNHSSSFSITSQESQATSTRTNPIHLLPVNSEGQTTRIKLTDFSTVHMRAFHMTWVAFFICFIGWFGLSPLLYSVMRDIDLTTDQVTFTNQAAIAVTILMRICMGVICDKFGPRTAYAALMFIGALPLIFVSLTKTFIGFVTCRMLIGVLGASFVITEYHTGVMFAPNVVGLASATVAGWGNLGGGVTNSVMPYVAEKIGFLMDGTKTGQKHDNWRVAIVIPGVLLIVMSVLYYKGTKDTPYGNRNELTQPNIRRTTSGSDEGVLGWLSEVPEVISDYRVFILTLAYAACFGVELVFLTQGSLYFQSRYNMTDKDAGNVVLIYSCLNLFCRPLGGWVSDKAGIYKNLHWRVYWLALTLLLEALTFFIFAKSSAVVTLVVVTFMAGLTTMLAEGATYAVVPFINSQSVGLVCGIVAAGGNIGGVLLLSLFRHGIPWEHSFFYLGVFVLVISFVVPLLRFPEAKLQRFDLSESIYRMSNR